MPVRVGFAVLWLAACNFPALPRISVAEDAHRPVTCSDLVCDPNATCTASALPACRCNPGYAGDGTSCSDIDECAAGTSGCAAACLNTTGGFSCYAPKTCADIKAQIPSATDGTYTLYLDGDGSKPWNAYCAHMADSPLEYLTLSGMNFSQYAAGGRATGTSVQTTYSKVRFVVASKKIDISDRAFATLVGSVNHPVIVGPDIPVTAMPYAVAMDCAGGGSHTGAAMIDLSGTQFALLGDPQFSIRGNSQAGTIELSSNNQQAKLTGGGNCGWTAPEGTPTNPFNDNVVNGVLLELLYLP